MHNNPPSHGIRIAIDRGGTFTDIYASIPGREDVVLKTLSVDPANYPDAPTEGIRRVLELATSCNIPRGQLLDLSAVESIRMGTTVATNALLERTGERVALLTTKGFRDLLRIGNQSRPDIFDLSITRPDVLFDRVIEVEERVTMEDYTEDPVLTSKDGDLPATDDVVIVSTGERVRILQKPKLAPLRTQLEQLKQEGFNSVAIVFLHSYAYPDHELAVRSLATSLGLQVTLSSQVQPMIKAVPRGNSAVVDAYLSPIVQRYIESISHHFNGGFAAASTRIEFMQSDGGLVDYRKFGGLKAILSGPAGGVVGYAQTTWDEDEKIPIIGFDMGGTSTDVSRFAGTYEHTFETTTAGIMIQSPQLDISTVAAGGGSILSWRNGLFCVGPESASSHPGPACYRKGGPPTVTDANLFLGRLVSNYFPSVFGPKEDEPLSIDAAEEQMIRLTEDINQFRAAAGLKTFTPQEVALGFLKVADESMAGPIRTITESRGYLAEKHHLASFGGAGGQHACSVASVLGIPRVVIHKYSSILSAYGLSLADVVHEVQRPSATLYNDATQVAFQSQLESLATEGELALMDQGFSKDNIIYEYYLNMRYVGSNSSIMTLKGDDWNFRREFEKAHSLSFGFQFSEKDIIVDDIRVRCIGKSEGKTRSTPFTELRNTKEARESTTAPSQMKQVYFEGNVMLDTPVYELQNLESGTFVLGAAILIDSTQTIVVPPKAKAMILSSYVVIDVDRSNTVNDPAPQDDEDFSQAELSVFGYRFMSIAEQMGRTLQRTSVSTNIKERLDFSCAIFGPNGDLVANAPHVPVHLGSMSYAVKHQAEIWKGRLSSGDVLVTNHPMCGGTHLPDITVITPVFDDNDIIFYVASRGHHADIGGILPGSMPPTSTSLWQEGAAIETMKLVSKGAFHEEELRRVLLTEPAQYPGCSGSRKVEDNISDLKAQIAANAKGISLLQGLVSECSLRTVHRYMLGIQQCAQDAVRSLLKDCLQKFGSEPLEFVDYMDDGTPIRLKITIRMDGTAIFDFTGTGLHVLGNTNAPIAITNSAILYSLRGMISSAIPLNQGCLEPIEIIIPKDSLLNPGSGLAVVGGNVLTSQRVTDVVLGAFRAAAASQGCCNNLTFGTGGKDPATGQHVEGFGYYETIAGGAGAGPYWHGQSGVHTHMTNTRITDPEVFEKRYPCILRRFELRPGSGGRGLYRGGDGAVREIEFRVPVQCSILSERRSRPPYGMAGGGEAQMGRNSVVVKDIRTGQMRTLGVGAKATIALEAGERIIVESPGGGGWGQEGQVAIKD